MIVLHLKKNVLVKCGFKGKAWIPFYTEFEYGIMSFLQAHNSSSTINSHKYYTINWNCS